MPTYSYACERCATQSTELRPINARQESATCPGCGGAAFLVPSSFNAPASSPKVAAARPAGEAPKQRGLAGVLLRDVHFSNCNVGISMPQGANVGMERVSFDNVKTPVDLSSS